MDDMFTLIFLKKKKVGKQRILGGAETNFFVLWK